MNRIQIRVSTYVCIYIICIYLCYRDQYYLYDVFILIPLRSRSKSQDLEPCRCHVFGGQQHGLILTTLPVWSHHATPALPVLYFQQPTRISAQNAERGCRFNWDVPYLSAINWIRLKFVAESFKMQKQPTSVSTVVGKPPASLKEAPDPMMWNDQATQICRCNVGCELSNNELTSNGVQKNPGKISTSDCLYHQGDWLSEIKQVKYSTYKVKPKKTFSAQHSRSWNGFGFRSISCQVSRIELNHNKLINLNRLQQYPPKYLQ